MTATEQQIFKTVQYNEAMRYMDNAKETLKNANKEDNYYNDIKYVRTACGTAYNAVLIAVEAWLKLRLGNSFKKPKSIEAFRELVAKQDKKLLHLLNNAYESLHLSGYYLGTHNVKLVKTGFEDAYDIIDLIKP